MLETMVSVFHMLATLMCLFLVAVPSMEAAGCPGNISHVCSCFSGRRYLSLNCAERSLDSVPDLTSFQGFNISRLLLSDNYITHIPKDSFSGLYFQSSNRVRNSILAIEKNDLRTISDHAFRGVQGYLNEITFMDCSLTEFPATALSDLPHLKVISMRGNNITTIPDGAFRKLTQLKKLVFTDNPLKDFNREGILSGLESTLETLDMSSMDHMTVFPSKLMRNLQRLSEIIFRYNDIATIPDDLFAGFQTTRPLHVDLKTNDIRKISKHYLRGSNVNLTRLEMSYNFLTNLDFVDVCLPVFQRNMTISEVPPIMAWANRLICDCDLFHLLTQVAPYSIQGSCDQPRKYQQMVLYAISQESFYEHGMKECPTVQPVDCVPSGCDCLMTASLYTFAYVTLVYVVMCGITFMVLNSIAIRDYLFLYVLVCTFISALMKLL